MLPKTNQHGMDFNKFTKTLGDIYKNTVAHLHDKTGISEDPLGDNQSPRLRQKVGKQDSVSPLKNGSVLDSSSKAFFGHKTTVAGTSIPKKVFDRQGKTPINSPNNHTSTNSF